MSDYVNITWNRPCVYCVNSGKESLNLLPGVNAVPSSFWDSVKDNKNIKARIESGLLKVSGRGNIDKMDSKEAVELIEKTVSLETLKKWDEGTKDKIIKGAIKRQFKYLTEDEKIVTEKKDAKPELKDSKDSKKIDKIVKAK